ncbi:unnamed protein product [Rhodiola kirilowii]
MVGSGQSSSSIASKVFTMTPEEENYRTKLQRTDSPDVSSAIPLFVPSFSKPASSVFSFTATKNEQAQVGVRTGHLKGTMRCRVCKRRNVMMRSSTAESNTLAGKLWPLSRDDISFSINSVNFKQQEPSRLLVHSTANSSSIYGIQPQRITTTAGSMTSLGCPNLITTSMVKSDDKNYPDKKLEDADQIVKEASELVKLLESRIAALQLSAQALKTPSERKMQASPMNSYLNPKTEEAVNNPFRQTKKHKLVETSMPPRPPLHQSIRASYSCCQQSPNLLNLSPVITFPQQGPSLSYTPSQIQYVAPCQTRAASRPQSLAPSLSYTPNQIQYNAPCQSHASNRRQSPAPRQILEPRPDQSSVKSYKLSRIPNQKQSSTPGLNVKNIVQRLESLNMSPNQNKLEKAHIRRRTRAGGAGSVASTSSGVKRPSKQSNTPSKSRVADLTRKARNPKSKSISSHKIPPRQYSSDYSENSGSSVSSSSWTTTQQSGSESGPEESNEYSYSSSASLSSQAESYVTPESEYSTEATSSSATSQSQSQTSRRRRLSRPRSFNRRHRKDRSPSPISRLRRIKNKLGLIFHHHHHHHHHDVEKPKSLWKKVNQKTVVRQPHEAAVKNANESVVKRRDQQGHFHALIDGLMRHVRHQRKKKKKTTPLKNVGRQKKKVVQWGKVVKHRRKLKLPNINKIN